MNLEIYETSINPKNRCNLKLLYHHLILISSWARSSTPRFNDINLEKWNYSRCKHRLLCYNRPHCVVEHKNKFKSETKIVHGVKKALNMLITGQSCFLLNYISVISSMFIDKFVQKCQYYYTFSDQSVHPLGQLFPYW